MWETAFPTSPLTGALVSGHRDMVTGQPATSDRPTEQAPRGSKTRFDVALTTREKARRDEKELTEDGQRSDQNWPLLSRCFSTFFSK